MVRPLVERALTVEYTSLTRAGAPIMTPLTPFPGDGTVDVSTGLSYPAKAERARRNPKVSLLFSDPVGSGLDRPPVVLVQGVATVRDADLQANTDRYVRLTLGKLPAAYEGVPSLLMRRLNAYFARIWIQVTPIRVWWWDSASLDAGPSEWVAPSTTVPSPSDPAPAGKQPPAWLEPPPDWRSTARAAMDRLASRDLAWVDEAGYPLSVPVLEVTEADQGLRLRVGSHLPGTPHGPACLTLHGHEKRGAAQENHTLIGTVENDGEHYLLRVERALADFSLTGNRLVRTVGFLRKMRKLQPRLRAESARRGQPVPSVRLPAGR